MRQTIPISDKAMTTVAGILLFAYQLRKQLGLGDPGPADISEALKVSRSQMYAMAQPARALLEAAREAGRPAGLPDTDDNASLVKQLAVSVALAQWLVAHPGAVYAGQKRMRYSDPFRRFVIDLLSPGGAGHGLTREKAACALSIPVHTLTHWLSARLPEPHATQSAPTASEPGQQAPESEPAVTDASNADDIGEEDGTSGAESSSQVESPAVERETNDDHSDEDAVKLPTSQWAATAAQVVDLWGRWKGNFAAFCRSLPDHGINYSSNLVRNILAVTNERPVKRRRPQHPDPEAIRGELTRMFANAQWNADGKNVVVQVGDSLVRLTWELVTDNATSAHLGFAVRENEDSAGVLEAMDQAETTAGEPPVAFLRDPRKSNTAETIEKELEDKEVLSMFSGVGRPQTNSPAETEFSLFAQKMPPIYIPDGLSTTQLAQLVLWYVLFAYGAGRNQTPRRRLKNRTPAQVFEESAIPDEQKAQAREQFRELRRQVEAQEAAHRRRCAPALMKILSEFFAEVGLDDPRQRFSPQIGAYGPEAALEAIALFKAKLEAGTLTAKNRERYLLGIARNVAYRREDERTYGYYVKLRAKAGDLVLQPLVTHDIKLQTELAPDEYRKQILDLALDSEAKVDRVFWRTRFIDHFTALNEPKKHEQGRWCARRIASRIKLDHRERDHFIALLAEAAMPLAA